MEGDHLPHVHAVDVVGGEHGDHVGRVRLDEVHILENRIRGALERLVRTRQQHLDQALGAIEGRRPGRLDVLYQRLGLVLRHDVDLGDAGIDQVAQDEVDNAITVCKGKRRLRMLSGQGIEPCAFPASEDQGNDIH